MTIYRLLLFFAFAFIICNCKSSKNTNSNTPSQTNSKKYLFQFHNASLLGEVLDQARKENKWVYMDVGAKWCVPCQLMKRDVYTHAATADFFNKNFIPYLVDAEKGEGPDVRIIYNLTSYPTLLFLDANGREKMRHESGIGISGLMKLGQDALNLKAQGN